jgi:hypothetical protein
MAKFEKGKSGNAAGRPPGSENRATKEIRVILKSVLGRELEQLPDIMDKLEPRDRVDMICKMLKFIMPPISKVGSGYGEPPEPVQSISEMLAEM